MLPDWLRAEVVDVPGIHIEVYECAGYLLLLSLAFVILRRTDLLGRAVHRLLAWRRFEFSAQNVARRLRPTGWFTAIVVLRWGILCLAVDRVLLVGLLTVLNPLFCLTLLLALFGLIDLLGDLIEAHKARNKRRVEFTQMLWPVASLATKILLFLAVLFRLMSLFSWDVTTLLTGLGIGGLAFALGAQDSLKNLFGSFTLIADRPFVVGEVVAIGDQGMGTVEFVGLRSTRIRTSDDTLLIVPNSNLTTMNIINFGRRRYRRYQTKIGVVYATPPERLAEFRDRIRDLLRQNPWSRKDGFEVTIDDLGSSGVEIVVDVLFDVNDRHQELEARESFILALLRLAEELQIRLAFPTQTVHLVPPATTPAAAVSTITVPGPGTSPGGGYYTVLAEPAATAST
jgi:MscS family membrane protein